MRNILTLLTVSVYILINVQARKTQAQELAAGFQGECGSVVMATTRKNACEAPTTCVEPIIAPDCPLVCNNPDHYEPATEIQRIDVLHYYTPELLAVLDGFDAVASKVDDLVVEANEIFAESGALLELRSVGIEEVPIAVNQKEDAGDILFDLAFSAPVNNARDAASADIVALLVTEACSKCNEECSKLCGRVREVMKYDTVGPQFQNKAFHITVVGDLDCKFTYAHETGHLLGLRHDRCSEAAQPECGSFCFAYGYADPVALSRFRTVMSTSLTCTDVGVSCERIGFFSNSLVLRDGRPMWKEGESNAARVINLTAPIVANFRPENDNFGKRYILEGLGGSASSNNDGATHESGEPFHGGNPANSVWWEWTAPVSGQALFDSSGSSFPSLTSVYTGPTVGTLTLVEDTDPADDIVQFEAIGNVTYLISIDSAGSETGDVDLAWNLVPGIADVSVSLRADSEIVEVGDRVFYTAAIENAGPQWATNLTLTNNLGPDLQFIFAYVADSFSADDCIEDSGTIVCSIDIVPDIGEPTEVVIEARVLNSGPISNTVSIEAAESDPVSANDSATAEVVGALSTDADISVTLSSVSDPVLVGSDITWLAKISNNGPSAATNAVLTNVLPPSVAFAGTNMPESCSEESGIVTCQVGTLLRDESFPAIEITATANHGGIIVNTVDVLQAENDPQPLNNTTQTRTIALDSSGVFEAKIIASDGAAGDEFGRSLSVEGSTLVVGSPLDDDSGFTSGSVYVFEFDGSQWVETQKLTASDAAPGDGFGDSEVAIEGGLMAIAARGEDGQSTNSGAVYLFEYDGNRWFETKKLFTNDFPRPTYGQWLFFGTSVAVSKDADTVAVGATGKLTRNGAGSVFVFEKVDGEFVETQTLTPSDGFSGDNFGRSVAINDKFVAVGASGHNKATGAVYIFQKEAGVWLEKKKIIVEEGRTFGWAVAFSSRELFISSPGTGESGAIYIFERSGELWAERQVLSASELQPGSNLGISISVDGDYLLAGVATPSSNDGASYIFKKIDRTWIEMRRIISSDRETSDFFGKAVAVDGNTALIGSQQDDDSCPSDPSCNSGSAYIYDLSALPAPSITVTGPAGSATLHPAASAMIAWTSTNTNPADSIVLSMKRDSVPPSVTEPDGINWFRFTEDTLNDGNEIVNIPPNIAFASDWRFYARHIDSGAFDGSDVTFTIADPNADLSVSLAGNPNPVVVGNNIAYTITVSNEGPGDASNVILAHTLPAGTSFVSTNQPDVCNETSGGVTCTIGALAKETTFPAIEIVIAANMAGIISSTVEVNGAEPDPNHLNDTAEVSTEVVENAAVIFIDGFESGDMMAWSSAQP